MRPRKPSLPKIPKHNGSEQFTTDGHILHPTKGWRRIRNAPVLRYQDTINRLFNRYKPL